MVFVIFFCSLALIVFFSCFVSVQQGTCAVITMFGKYRRIMTAGLNFKLPIFETVFRKISLQNQAEELEFQAISLDQANVFFKAMILFGVVNQAEETIKNVAFKFIDHPSLMRALIRTVEGSVRSFVATKKQSEILQLRREIIEDVKHQLDTILETWGYHVIDLQMNDITFDQEILTSMARVVASSNLKSAAENEGQALLITKTKAAEAEGTAIKISAEAEKVAAQLRGQGVALFREEVAKGMASATEQMHKAGLDVSVILFSMWTDAVKHFAETGKGNTIFLDGSTDAMSRNIRELMSLQKTKQEL